MNGPRWPEHLRAPLFQVAFGNEAAARAGWDRWRADVNLDHYPDLGSFRLLPLAHERMAALGVDDPIMARLKGIIRRNWYKNQEVLRSGVPILEQLALAGIETMLLDSAAVALAYRNDYAPGQEKTLDVAVRPDRVREALGVLLDAGLRCAPPVARERMGRLIAAAPMAILVASSGDRVVLHWRLFPAGAGADEIVWEQAVNESIGAFPVLAPTAAHQIARSAARLLAVFPETRFERAVDWMLLSSAVPADDWPVLAEFCAQNGLAAPALAVLDELEKNLGEPPPMRTHFAGLRPSDAERRDFEREALSPARRFWSVWNDQRRLDPQRSSAARLTSLPAHLRDLWGLGSAAQIPARALAQLRRRY